MDKGRKELLLREIGERLKTSSKEIKRKMRSLTQYHQLKREQERPSGSASQKKPKWPFYDRLSFLNDNVTPKQTISNFSSRLASSIGSPPSHPSSSIPGKVRKLNRDDYLVVHNELMTRAVCAFENDKEEAVENQGGH